MKVLFVKIGDPKLHRVPDHEFVTSFAKKFTGKIKDDEITVVLYHYAVELSEINFPHKVQEIVNDVNTTYTRVIVAKLGDASARWLPGVQHGAALRDMLSPLVGEDTALYITDFRDYILSNADESHIRDICVCSWESLDLPSDNDIDKMILFAEKKFMH